MKTLRTLTLVLGVLFISLTSFSQTTHTFYVTETPNIPNQSNEITIIDTTVIIGDKVEFYNSTGGTDKFSVNGDPVGIPASLITDGSLISSFTFNDLGDKTFLVKSSSFQFRQIKVKFIVIAQSTASINTLSDIKFNIFPNPPTDLLNISGDQIENVKVFDVNGRIVLSKDFNATDVKLDVSKLEKGIYSVVVNGNSKITFIKE